MIQTLFESTRFRLFVDVGLLFLLLPPFFGYLWTRGALLAQRHEREAAERKEAAA